MVTTLLQNGLTVALLAPVVWLATRFLRRSAVAHLLWVTLLVKLITPPLIVIPVDIFNESFLSNLFQSSGFHVGLTTVWICGSIFVMLTFLKKAEMFRQAIVGHGSVHAPASDLAAEVDPGGYVLRTPEVVLVDAVHSPMVCGMGPYSWILFPKDLWFALSIDQRRGLLAHELAHFRRGDCYVRVLELVVTFLFWWHPALWLIKREIESAEEDCCDALASRHGAKNYARAILATLDFLSEPEQFRPAISTMLLGRKSAVERRIVRILKSQVNPEVTRGQRFCLAGTVLLILALSPQFGSF